MPVTEYEAAGLQKIKHFIDANIQQHFTIGELSLRAGMGETKLKILFKQNFNTSIYAYLIRIRMLKAEQLLLETDYPLKKIAYLTGYKYTPNLIHAFRLRFGISPIQYRKIKNQ